MYRWLVGNLRLWSATQTLVAYPLWDGESEHDEQGNFLKHIHSCLCF